ncbi:MAG: arylesterase [Balneolaceae bacterium]
MTQRKHYQKVAYFLLLFLIGTGLQAQERTQNILFFGDSITAGYGLSEEQAYPARIGEKLNEHGYNYRITNAGLSGETTAGGVRRVDWILRQDVEIFVLALGGNDGLRGIDPELTKENLQGIIDKVRNHNADIQIILAGIEAPPNMGSAYTDRFRNMYPELAEENGIPLFPFILEGVAGDPELNLPDGIHPTAEGHEIIADHFWDFLQPLL